MRTYAEKRPAAPTFSASPQPLDARTRARFEPRFGHDFGRVRIHNDDAAARSAREHDALAYTFGRDVVFGANQYRPNTAEGDRLIAHELRHVVEQHNASPSIQRQPTRVSRTDDWEKHLQTEREIEAFQKGGPYKLKNYRRNGFFDASYDPPNFNVVVKVEFDFIEDWTAWPDETPDADMKWTPAEKKRWREQYLTDVAAAWNAGRFLLFCTEPGWERLIVPVVVRFVDAKEVGETKHFHLNIRKVPSGYVRQAETRGPQDPEQFRKMRLDPTDARAWGEMDLDSESFQWQRKSGWHYQRAAVHEAGHALGLADTYVKNDTFSLHHQAAFQKRAQRELGEAVPIRDDSRMMSVGEKLGPSDGITFVEAIRAATGKQWSLFMKKAPRRPPHAPEDINDLVKMKETVV